MIIVTGATGDVGGRVARELAARGVPCRLIVRDPARAPDLPGAEVAVASFDDPEALSTALDPGDRVFMVSMHAEYAERLALHRSFVEVAARRRVGRVIYLSYLAPGADATFIHARSHGATEAMLRESGLPWSAVRNGMYGDMIASWFDPDGRITGPGGDGRVSFSYRPELGEVIATLLVEPAHDDREIVTVTTPESVSLSELAALATEVTGDPYRYEPVEREVRIAYRRGPGRPDWSIEAGISSVTSRDLIELAREEMPLAREVQACPAL
jgi:NAD(P)H dehydrogenase (quinone)